MHGSTGCRPSQCLVARLAGGLRRRERSKKTAAGLPLCFRCVGQPTPSQLPAAGELRPKCPPDSPRPCRRKRPALTHPRRSALGRSGSCFRARVLALDRGRRSLSLFPPSPHFFGWKCVGLSTRPFPATAISQRSLNPSSLSARGDAHT